jgi:hypothetical protein
LAAGPFSQGRCPLAVRNPDTPATEMSNQVHALQLVRANLAGGRTVPEPSFHKANLNGASTHAFQGSGVVGRASSPFQPSAPPPWLSAFRYECTKGAKLHRGQARWGIAPRLQGLRRFRVHLDKARHYLCRPATWDDCFLRESAGLLERAIECARSPTTNLTANWRLCQ